MNRNANYRPRDRARAKGKPVGAASRGTVVSGGSVAAGGGNPLTRLYRCRIRPHITKKRAAIAAGLFIIAMMALPVATYAYFARDISDRDRLMNRNNTGIILKDRTGQTFYSSGVLSSADDVPLDKISDDLETALVASEDQRFYSHNGFSTSGILGALFSNIKSGSSTGSGGSTITQQLVKNKLLSSKKSYIRKYQEVAMAVAVERRYSKQEILDMYLNSVYFGEGAFGISDAAKTYFGKAPADLTLAESSMLVGLLPAPSSRSPISGDPALAKDAQNNVLRKMQETGKIDRSQRDAAYSTQLAYASRADRGGAEYAQHFAEMVINQLEEKYGEEKVKRSGFEVTTTLDLNKQKEAEAIIRDQVAKTASRGGRNSGMVAIDPKTGQVMALVGSVDYYNESFGQVNMALARRQPGSSFKPIYYSEALAKGLISPATILQDVPKTYGGTYTPKNYDNAFKGPMPVRSALPQSRNITAIEVLGKVGIKNAAAAASRMGIDGIKDPESYGLAFALGTAEVQLIDMVNAYAAFGNQGMQHDPVLYTKISDKYDTAIEEVEAKNAKRVLSDDGAFLTSSILSDTAARAPAFGSSLNVSGKNVALKTGTTNDNRDAWTIGYTPSMAVGVWLGNNENEPMRSLAGGSGAGATWKRIMTAYLAGSKREEFVKPSSIVSVTICSGTDERSLNADGGQATKSEFFARTNQPKGTCNENAKPVEQVPEPTETPEDPNNGQTTTPTTPTTPTSPTTPTTPTTPTSPSSGTNPRGGGGTGGTTPRGGTGTN